MTLPTPMLSQTTLSLLSLRVSVVDVLGAVSYILRREVALHSTVTGAAFTTLLRLVHLLESVRRHTTHTMMSEHCSGILSQLLLLSSFSSFLPSPPPPSLPPPSLPPSLYPGLHHQLSGGCPQPLSSECQTRVKALLRIHHQQRLAQATGHKGLEGVREGGGREGGGRGEGER